MSNLEALTKRHAEACRKSDAADKRVAVAVDLHLTAGAPWADVVKAHEERRRLLSAAIEAEFALDRQTIIERKAAKGLNRLSQDAGIPEECVCDPGVRGPRNDCPVHGFNEAEGWTGHPVPFDNV